MKGKMVWTAALVTAATLAIGGLAYASSTQPALYALRVEVRDRAGVVDVVTTPFGIRSIAFDKGAPPQTLLVGKETTQGTQKQVFAKRGDQPTIVALGDWSLRTLAKDAWQFREKTVLGFSADRVGRIVIERKEGTGVTLVHGEPGGWKVDGQEQSKAGAIQRFVDDLRDLRGSAIAQEPAKDLKAFGLDAPDVRVTLTDRGDMLFPMLVGRTALAGMVVDPAGRFLLGKG